MGYRCPFLLSLPSLQSIQYYTHTFWRLLDGWFEAVHVVASVTVVTEQQLVLQRAEEWRMYRITHAQVSRKWDTVPVLYTHGGSSV